MKVLSKCGVIVLINLFVGTAAYAAEDHSAMANSKGMWMCETNASSASSDADIKADEAMKKASPAKAAFDFALKHCRDCTKINCSMEDKS